MKLCESCRYRNNTEYEKPCVVYRDDCEYYEKERDDMTDDLISRQAVLDDVLKASNLKKYDWIIDAREKVKAMPNVTPTLEKCEDCISRDAVWEVMQELWGTSGELLDRLMALPSVTPTETHMWIPVSERLPEDAFGCLVTVYDTDLRTQNEFENILPYTVGYDGETWNNFCGEPIPFEVLAWMPLPEPYKVEPQERSDKE